MTKKQAKEIANRWAAGLLLAAGGDSFTDEMGLTEQEINMILVETWGIANRLLGKHTYQPTINDILNVVLSD